MRLRLAVASAAALVSLAGCGSFAEEYPPTGIDELTIPTPSPDPADFVDGIDHPLLAWAPGATLTYRAADGASARVVSVLTEPVEVAGVATTAVRDVLTGAGGTTEETRFYAEDGRGNVWLLGVDSPSVSWRAGEGGAEAGLAMAAEPRVGDSHRTGLAPGFDEVVEITELDDAMDIGHVTLERRSGPTAPGSAVSEPTVVEEEYVEGTGLIRRDDPATGVIELLTAP